MTLIATYTITSSDSKPAAFILPNLLSDCPYPLCMNTHSHDVSHTSEEWLFTEAHIAEPEIAKFRAICIVYLDDCDIDDVKGIHECCISASCNPINFQTENPAGKICKLIFSHFTETASLGCTKQAIHALDLYFITVAKEGHWVHNSQIDLPDEVVSHPVIMAMEDTVTDYAAWCNDIFSYNKEQLCNDAYSNVIAVLMHKKGLDLRGTVDYSGQLCKSAIQRFEDNCATLPLQVAIYIQGLQDLVIGMLHWSFDSPCYFRKDAGQTVR
ncbi:terpene synthase [Suillus subluteus]|nr:terpene synthase [Suillus subluteus]